MSILNYLQGYPPELIRQVNDLITQQRLGDYLKKKYPMPHEINNEHLLYEYVMDLKRRYLKQSSPLSKVAYDGKIQMAQKALGLNTQISRVQGGKLKAKSEIRIATVFKQAPLPLLNMIAVHELAHLKERDHNKSFYKLCTYMLPEYHQLEFDTRLYLIHLEQFGELYISQQ